MDLQEIGEGNVMGMFVEQLGYKFDELTGDITARAGGAPHLHQPNCIVDGGCALHGRRDPPQRRGDERGKCVGVNNSTDFYRAVSTGTLTSTTRICHRADGALATGAGPHQTRLGGKRVSGCVSG